MSEANSTSEATVYAREALAGLLQRLGIEAEIMPEQTEGGRLVLQLTSSDAGRLIGRHAETLDALELVLSRMVRHAHRHAPDVVVDVDGYRQRHLAELEQRARKALREVRETGLSSRFPPMNTADRRVVHRALANETDVRTTSIAGGRRDGFKELEVQPVELPPADEAGED